jgi:hypothetical protein
VLVAELALDQEQGGEHGRGDRAELDRGGNRAALVAELALHQEQGGEHGRGGDREVDRGGNRAALVAELALHQEQGGEHGRGGDREVDAGEHARDRGGESRGAGRPIARRRSPMWVVRPAPVSRWPSSNSSHWSMPARSANGGERQRPELEQEHPGRARHIAAWISSTTSWSTTRPADRECSTELSAFAQESKHRRPRRPDIQACQRTEEMRMGRCDDCRPDVVCKDGDGG